MQALCSNDAVSMEDITSGSSPLADLGGALDGARLFWQKSPGWSATDVLECKGCGNVFSSAWILAAISRNELVEGGCRTVDTPGTTPRNA